jgi:hypothetical protein
MESGPRCVALHVVESQVTLHLPLELQRSVEAGPAKTHPLHLGQDRACRRSKQALVQLRHRCTRQSGIVRHAA